MSHVICTPCGEEWDVPDADELSSIEQHDAVCPVLNESA